MAQDDDPIAPLSVNVADLSDACVRFVQGTLGILLDFTPDTLPILDHYLLEARKTPRAEILQLIAPAAGAYFGEVVKASLGPCRWYLEGDGPESVRLEFERCFLGFNPIGAALEAVLGEEAPGYGAHLQVLPSEAALVRESLERTGDVRREDYYRLAVRFEVIEQIATLLTARMADEENPPVIGPEVYAALRDQPTKLTLN